MNIDYSSKSRKDIGRLLALSLSKSGVPDEAEQKEAEDAGLSRDQYFNEIYSVAGFAIFYTLAVALSDTPHGEEVMAGYMEVWENLAHHDPACAQLVQVFKARLEPYQKAAQGFDPRSLNPIALRFGSFFGKPGTNAWLLIHKNVPSCFEAHVEITLRVLRDSKLITDYPGG